MTKNETQPGKMLAVTSTKWKQSHASTRRVAAFASNDIAGAPKSMVKQFAGRLHDILMQFAWVRGSGGCSTRESIQPILRWLSPDFIVSSYLHRGREREREREDAEAWVRANGARSIMSLVRRVESCGSAMKFMREIDSLGPTISRYRRCNWSARNSQR